jgi:hypothetical protein
MVSKVDHTVDFSKKNPMTVDFSKRNPATVDLSSRSRMSTSTLVGEHYVK